MNSFKDFLSEKKEDHKNGTYVSAQLSKESTDELYKWCQDNKITNAINPHLPDNEYHATVVYSRKGIPEAKKEDIGLPINVKLSGWEIFTSQNGNKCLVGRFTAPELNTAHNTFREKYGATSDFPDYKSHITVSYDYGSDKVPKDYPKFDLTFDKREFKALDPTYMPSNKKD